MKSRLGLGILLLIVPAALGLSACGSQETAPASTPGEFGEQLDSLLPELLQRHRTPGAAVALVDNGAVVWAEGYGLADEKTGAPMTAETVFQVASISKSVTAWGVMRLVEAGAIDLDLPVAHYLKTWRLPQSEFDQQGVTVRRLLSHSAGLAPWGYQGARIEEMAPSTVDLVSGATSAGPVRLVREPGERDVYSNGGYTLLQLLVEDVTGEPFAETMAREVLGPLGMDRSGYQWDPAWSADLATGYQIAGRPVDHRSYPAAAGGLYATVIDVATWLAAGMPGPDGEPAGREVLAPETVALMQTPLGDASPSVHGLGYGIESLPDGTRMVSHSGDFPGWRGQYLALPDRRAGIVVLTNSSGGGRYVVADTICRWVEWSAGARPDACRIYQVVYLAMPVLASLGGLAVLASAWRLGTQIRSNRRRVAWRPMTDRQRRDVVFAMIATAGWWLVVIPRIGLLLPRTFSWVSLAFTLWCVLAAVRGLTVAADEPV